MEKIWRKLLKDDRELAGSAYVVSQATKNILHRWHQEAHGPQ
jgi:hypothetical protein